jgi:opacity protein-like surface antigen
MRRSREGTGIVLGTERNGHVVAGILATALAVLALAGPARADNTPGSIALFGKLGSRPLIRDHALEIGVSGSGTRVSNQTAGTATLHLGTFRNAGAWLLGLEAEPSFTRAAGTNYLDAEGAVSWQKEIGLSPTYAFIAMGGGLRERWPGGTKTRLYPMGGNAGLIFLITDRVGVRTEYRYRRVLNPKGDDVNEHEIQLGISVFAHNAPKPWIK